MFETGVKN